MDPRCDSFLYLGYHSILRMGRGCVWDEDVHETTRGRPRQLLLALTLGTSKQPKQQYSTNTPLPSREPLQVANALNHVIIVHICVQKGILGHQKPHEQSFLIPYEDSDVSAHDGAQLPPKKSRRFVPWYLPPDTVSARSSHGASASWIPCRLCVHGHFQSATAAQH